VGGATAFSDGSRPVPFFFDTLTIYRKYSERKPACFVGSAVMSAAIGYGGIPAADPEAAGAFLAWVLCAGNVVPDGPPDASSGDMFALTAALAAAAG
jgi:hypothetical protein